MYVAIMARYESYLSGTDKTSMEHNFGATQREEELNTRTMYVCI